MAVYPGHEKQLEKFYVFLIVAILEQYPETMKATIQVHAETNHPQFCHWLLQRKIALT